MRNDAHVQGNHKNLSTFTSNISANVERSIQVNLTTAKKRHSLLYITKNSGKSLRYKAIIIVKHRIQK